jgi:segregation and condensation protein B
MGNTTTAEAPTPDEQTPALDEQIQPTDEISPDTETAPDAATPGAAAAAGPRVVADEQPAEVDGAHIVEALLFASDTPISAARLAELSGLGSVKTVKEHITALNEKYAQVGLSFRIEAIAKGYQMLTVAAYRTWLAKLDKQRSQSRLTAAALETLAIVAYKQPIIRSDIEAIRGVACGEVLNRLREMGLVKIVGRAEIVGRPMLYGTTRKFLDVFGLADLDDLPPMESLVLKKRQQAAREETDEDPPQQIAAAGA